MILAGLAMRVRVVSGTGSNRVTTDRDLRAASRAVPCRSVFLHLVLAIAMFVTAASAFTLSSPAAYAADDRVADFTTTVTTGPAPLAVGFVGTSNGEPTGWAWDFGDSATDSIATPSHTYVTVGTFTVRLTVTYPDHPPVVVTRTDLIVVVAPPTVLAAGIGLAGIGAVAGQPVTFVDASTGSPTTWAWEFGDADDGTATDAGPTYIYPLPGTFVVTLTVRNDDDKSVATASITVLAAWTGTLQLYQKGVYSPQRTDRWCTPASTQMIRNMITGERDHSSRNQRMYYAFGRANNGFRTPGKDGVDPAGWQAVLQRWGDPGYHIVAASNYTSAVSAAAQAMRLTGRPVAVLVGHGSHAWVMSGFTATADPALTDSFTITSVNVEGPLHGRPVVRGFDPVPNVRLSATRFRRFLTPYRDKYEPLGWRNRYVVIVP